MTVISPTPTGISGRFAFNPQWGLDKDGLIELPE